MIEHRDGSVSVLIVQHFFQDELPVPGWDGWLELNESNVKHLRFGYHTEEAEESLRGWSRYLSEKLWQMRTEPPEDLGTPYARVELVAEAEVPEPTYDYDEIPF